MQNAAWRDELIRQALKLCRTFYFIFPGINYISALYVKDGDAQAHHLHQAQLILDIECRHTLLIVVRRYEIAAVEPECARIKPSKFTLKGTNKC